MNRLDRATAPKSVIRRGWAGYTLVEILTATALSAMLMLGVVEVFSMVADSVNSSRATLETSDRLRAAATRLQMDLAGVTVTMRPPRRVADDEGYFEYLEGPVGIPPNLPSAVAVDGDGNPDTTVGDFDDVLMFTARSSGEPFVGRYWNPATNAQETIESDVAEIAWFLRGPTLYRRVLLVVPGAPLGGSPFFAVNDISVRVVGTNLFANTLGDLTRRECRFAHDTATGFPFSAYWGHLGLPTLREHSAGWPTRPTPPVGNAIDFWNPQPASGNWLPDPYPAFSLDGPRVGEDIILTNVIGFDVKAWDPAAQAYVDLGYNGAAFSSANTPFDHIGHPRSGLNGGGARVYDTWSWHYECDGIDQDNSGTPDQGTNGFDDDGVNGVDDLNERETMPPYPVPLRGIQVKIRVFEPDSRTVREVTVVQDFLPK